MKTFKETGFTRWRRQQNVQSGWHHGKDQVLAAQSTHHMLEETRVKKYIQQQLAIVDSLITNLLLYLWANALVLNFAVIQKLLHSSTWVSFAASHDLEPPFHIFSNERRLMEVGSPMDNRRKTLIEQNEPPDLFIYSTTVILSILTMAW